MASPTGLLGQMDAKPPIGGLFGDQPYKKSGNGGEIDILMSEAARAGINTADGDVVRIMKELNKIAPTDSNMELIDRTSKLMNVAPPWLEQMSAPNQMGR